VTRKTSGFDPLWMFRAPWSGDVAQRITAPWFSPSLTVNYAGDPAVEDRVVTITLLRCHRNPTVIPVIPVVTVHRLPEADRTPVIARRIA
jgi:hypothetical protein